MSCLHSRGAGRRHSFLRRGLLAAGTMAATLSAGVPALADMGSTGVIGVVSPDIEILSDGEKYTAPAVAHGPVTANVNVWLDTEVAGRIKSFKVWLKLRTETSDWIDFRQDAYSASFPVGQRPKKLNKNYLVSVSSGSHATYLAGYCNAQAQALRLSGLSNEAIFSQDRPLEVAIHSGLEYEMSGLPGRYSLDTTGLGDSAWSDIPKMTVVCKGVPMPKVEQATLAARRGAALSNACTLDLSGEIHTDLPNTTVKFRYHSGDGRKSDVKTVVTNQYAIARFSHEYPLPDGGTRSDKIRIVGENIDFSSLWASFESDCDAPTQDIATALPPKATALEAHATADSIMHEGFICPQKVKIYGILKGRGSVEGATALFADDALKALKQYSIKDGDTVVVEGEHQLDWSDFHAFVADAVPQQSVNLAMNVTNKQGDLVDRMEGTQSFVCRKPETLGDAQGAAGGLAGEISVLKGVNLSASAIGTKKLGGYVCPAEVRVSGFVAADTPFSGKITLFAGGSQIHEAAVDLEANFGTHYSATYPLPWNGATLPEQTTLFAMKVENQHGVEVAAMEKTEVFACSGAPARPGQKTAGADAPQTRPGSSVIGRLAQQQAQAFAIQAPKGLVRQGEIRLSGGAANAKYTLKFLRKNGGGYVAVNAAQLPKQMTGLVASFPLKALTGGRDWRLEVCPAGGAATACKTADFRLTRIGAARAKAPDPAPEQPQGTIFLIPGVGQ